MTLLAEKSDSLESQLLSEYRCWCKHHNKFHQNDVCGICKKQAYKGNPLANWSYQHPIQDVFPEVPPFDFYQILTKLETAAGAFVKHMEKNGSLT